MQTLRKVAAASDKIVPASGTIGTAKDKKDDKIFF
jgi:hypothetical protein